MSEAKAHILAFAALSVPISATSVVISATDAGGVALGLAIVFFAGLGGWISGGIVVRYARLAERKKREEIILSR